MNNYLIFIRFILSVIYVKNKQPYPRIRLLITTKKMSGIAKFERVLPYTIQWIQCESYVTDIPPIMPAGVKRIILLFA